MGLLLVILVPTVAALCAPLRAGHLRLVRTDERDFAELDAYWDRFHREGL